MHDYLYSYESDYVAASNLFYLFVISRPMNVFLI